MKKKDIKILLVDDEVDILEIVGYNLSQEGYQIFTAENGKKAVEKAKRHQPHLIIMDVMMPEMDGMEACENIRKIPELSNTIITFLTARNEDYSQIAGLEAGGDDYVSKPIKPKVLISRINALLRRLDLNKSKDIIDNCTVRINRENYTVEKNGDTFHLPRKEFELLALLISQPNFVFKRNVILEKVWGSDIVVGDRTIDVHIRKLREKIGAHYITTIKGIGYKFNN